MKLKEAYPTENKGVAYYIELDSSYQYECPICREIQDMYDLTEREESHLRKGDSIYYECDFCKTITEVTCGD